MPQIENPDLPQLRFVEQPRQHVKDVPFFERGALARRENPLGQRHAFSRQRARWFAAPGLQGGTELRRSVDAGPLVRFGRRQHTSYEIALNRQEATVPIDVAIATPTIRRHAAGAERAQYPRIPRLTLGGWDGEQVRDIRAGEDDEHELAMLAAWQIEVVHQRVAPIVIPPVAFVVNARALAASALSEVARIIPPSLRQTSD